MFVIDASATLALCFADEQPPDPEAFVRQLMANVVLAPAHWPLEVTNILSLAERKGRVSADQVREFIELLGVIGVVIDVETGERAWVETLALAGLEGLTTYDAAYLELAMRRGATIVSKDADLLAAAVRRGVRTLDLRA